MTPDATANSAATICVVCGKPVTVASNPLGQTKISYYHGTCYRAKHADELHHAGPVHTVSHDERVEGGELLP